MVRLKELKDVGVVNCLLGKCKLLKNVVAHVVESRSKSCEIEFFTISPFHIIMEKV